MIEIVNASTDDQEQYELNVGSALRVVTLQVTHGIVKFNWGVYGPIQWPEAKAMLEGMLELSVLADQISERLRHEKASGTTRRMCGSSTANLHRRHKVKK